ncbi:hypothetical protein Aerorivi_01593 [Aeromonas rivipollensis]
MILFGCSRLIHIILWNSNIDIPACPYDLDTLMIRYYRLLTFI